MKLKSDFLSQDIDDVRFLVPVGTESLHGIVRLNKTAAFIVDCLKEETTEKKIVDSMCEKYDAPRDVMTEDTKNVLETLRKIGALEE